MRLLIVGSDNVAGIEKFFVKYIEEEGVTVSFFSAQNLFYDFYFKSIIHKAVYRAGMSTIHKTISGEFKKAVVEFKPDVIWVFKGMEMTPKTLQWARDLGVKLVNYNPDNPFIFSGKGSGNKNITDSVSLYDLHLTYNLSVKERIENEFKLPVSFLPFGFDLDENLYRECAAQQEILKVCFLGNPDAQRASFIKSLADANVQIDVFGGKWQRQLKHPNITLYDPVYSDDFWKTLRRYRVQLNVMRLHNPDSHNMRTFEIPGVGGIMLAPDTPEHRMFFTEGEEIFLYYDLNSCIDAINRILNLNVTEANKLRDRARNKSLQNGYTYKERSRQALQAISKTLNLND